MEFLVVVSIIFYIIGWLSCLAANNEFCNAEQTEQNRKQSVCIQNVFNYTEFSVESKNTIMQYSGDHAVVLSFAQRYCPAISEVVNCLPILLDISEECRHPIYYGEQSLQLKLYGVVLEFLCSNNAEALVALISRNTARRVSLISQCISQLYTVTINDPAFETFRVNPLYCEALGRVFDCFGESEEINANENLLRLLNNLYPNAFVAIGCQ